MRKFRLLEGHMKDMWFVQEKSLITKRYHIVAIHYNESHAKEDLSFKQKTAE